MEKKHKHRTVGNVSWGLIVHAGCSRMENDLRRWLRVSPAFQCPEDTVQPNVTPAASMIVADHISP